MGSADIQPIMPQLKLKCCEGKIFCIDADAARLSNILSALMDSLSTQSEVEHPIVLNEIKGSIIKKVIQWATYHKNDPPYVEETDETKILPTDDIGTWDLHFLDIDLPMLFHLIVAADILDMKGLLDLTLKTVAKDIKTKTTDEVRRLFNLRNDLNGAQREQLRNENSWMDKK